MVISNTEKLAVLVAILGLLFKVARVAIKISIKSSVTLVRYKPTRHPRMP